MDLDVEARLRRYGPMLDDAADRSCLDFADRAELTGLHRRRSATALTAAAAALMVLAAAALLLWRTIPPDATSTAPTGEPLPVVLAPDMVPWYLVDSAAVAGFEPDPSSEELRGDGGWQTAACVDWAASDDVVQCRELEIDGFKPNQTLSDRQGRRVSISTIHRDSFDALEYSSLWSYLRDAGYLESPNYVSFESLQVGGVDAVYTSTDDRDPGDTSATRRITFAAGPSTYVAVETQGFSRDDLLAFAASTDPVPRAEVPPIPLLLAAAATTVEPGYRPDRLLGGVIDGEICVYPESHITSDVADPCDPLEPEAPLRVIDADPHWKPGLYLGLTSGDVAAVRVDFEDGTSLSAVPREQPVGTTRAFAFFYPDARAARVSVVDAEGSELMAQNIEDDTPVATDPPEDG